MTEPQRVSVVIVTLNRADAIGLLLEELSYQDYDNFEIIVVVGPCEDDTESVLKPFDGIIKMVRCPSSNISKARNIGIQSAAGDIVIFIDDDAYPEKRNWVRSYVESLSENRDLEIGIVGGPVYVKNGDSYEFKSGLFDREGFQLFQRDANETDLSNRWLVRVAGGNNASYRETLVKMGGYDERIEYYLDETDVCARLHERGYEVVGNDVGIRHYRLPNRTRKGHVQVNRFQVAKSDFYFVLKHSTRPFGLRLLRAWSILCRKHYCREIFFQGHLNRLNPQQQFFSLISVLGGALWGSVIGLFPSKTGRVFENNDEFLPIDKPQLKRLGLAHVTFVNNEMGEGASFFEKDRRYNHQFQLYWSKDGQFSEANSELIDYPDGRRCKLSSKFENKEAFSILRVDPMRLPGKCFIESFTCYDADDNIVYELKASNEFLRLSDISIETQFQDGIRLISESEDPWFLLEMGESSGTFDRFSVVLKTESPLRN